jgi:hemerythrin
MADPLATLNKVRSEHLNIRRHLKLVGDSVGDVEAMNSLQGERAEWVPGRPHALDEKQKKLQQTLSFLDEGLRNHFALEEKDLAPLAGDLFMRALILDHREIMKHVDDTRSMVDSMDVDGLTREQLLSKESQVQQAIEHVRGLIQDHAAREETLLNMLERALQES